MKPLTIIVGGYIVGYPLGGMTWHHLNYLLGLHEMGHDVWFYEYGAWEAYNPAENYSAWDATYGTAYLERQFERYGFPRDKWCYTMAGKYFSGRTDEQMKSVFAKADLMICVSGITPIDHIVSGPRPRKMLVIDTDPVFTQLRMRNDANFVDYYKQFDAVATFGRLIGRADCPLPTHGFDWIPTNQPISLSHWPVVSKSSNDFTTIGKWEHSSERTFEFDGKRFSSSKGVEWMKLIDLPRKTNWDMTLGMSTVPQDIQRQFESHDWKVVNAESASLSCEAFQKFIQNSAGEFTVAKEIYSGLPSGWFSDRSAAYLASGRPVVTQASGFDRWLPTGEGLFSFSNLDEAAGALRAIESDYDRHAKAARRIAEEYFDSRKVLRELVDAVM